MLCLMLLALQMQTQDNSATALYLMEELTFYYPGVNGESKTREIWIGKNEIRTDRFENDEHISFVFVPVRRIIYIVNHTRKNYTLVLMSRDKNLVRSPLQGLAELEDGFFQKPELVAYPTNQKQKVSKWFCHEYQLNYPESFGIATTVWATRAPTPMDKNAVKLMWYAALGSTQTPYDVRNLINQIADEIDGVPIRKVSTIKQEGMTVTTVSTILEMEERAIPSADFFNVPPNYVVVSADQ